MKVHKCAHPHALAGLDWVRGVHEVEYESVGAVAPVLQGLVGPHVKNLEGGREGGQEKFVRHSFIISAFTMHTKGRRSRRHTFRVNFFL